MMRSALGSLATLTALVGAVPIARAQGAETPPATEEPPPIYYVEPAETAPSPSPPPNTDSGRPAQHARPPARVVEPPLPGRPPEVIWEPPPPPRPRHVAPRVSLWLGARGGWFIPFGYLFARAVQVAPGVYRYDRVEWHDYAGSGPLVELDVGVRLSRNYNLFALWEHADLSAGEASPDLFDGSRQRRGTTDFWGIGVRASSDPDDIGFLSELALGYRQARSNWSDGAELELQSGFLEARLGLGADIRVNEFFSLSPLLTFGVGTFSDIDFVDSQGRRFARVGRGDEYDGHGWITLQLGAHFDAFGRK